jgi:hypothetical protein
MERAWFLTSARGQEQNRFKANLTKIFGSRASVTAKEAQSNGYPAPHILLLLDKPVRVRRHCGKKGLSWRIEENGILEKMRNAWPWGFIDVEAVVGSENRKCHGYSTPVNYLAKYLTKHLDLTKYPELAEARTIQEIPNGQRTAVFTHLWNRILRSRDFYVSKAFKDRLNRMSISTPVEPQIDQDKWILSAIEPCLSLAAFLGIFNSERIRKIELSTSSSFDR